MYLGGNQFNIRHLQAKPKPTVSNFQMQDADYTALLASSPAAIQHMMYNCFSSASLITKFVVNAARDLGSVDTSLLLLCTRMSGSYLGCVLTPFCLIQDTTQACISRALVNCGHKLLTTTEGFNKSLCLHTAVSTKLQRSEAWINYRCFVRHTTSLGPQALTVMWLKKKKGL